jgi:hypothetical protein
MGEMLDFDTFSPVSGFQRVGEFDGSTLEPFRRADGGGVVKTSLPHLVARPSTTTSLNGTAKG